MVDGKYQAMARHRTFQFMNRPVHGIFRSTPHPALASVRVTVRLVPFNEVVKVSPIFAAQPVLAQLALDTATGHVTPAGMLTVLVFDVELPMVKIVVAVCC